MHRRGGSRLTSTRDEPAGRADRPCPRSTARSPGRRRVCLRAAAPRKASIASRSNRPSPRPAGRRRGGRSRAFRPRSHPGESTRARVSGSRSSTRCTRSSRPVTSRPRACRRRGSRGQSRLRASSRPSSGAGRRQAAPHDARRTSSASPRRTRTAATGRRCCSRAEPHSRATEAARSRRSTASRRSPIRRPGPRLPRLRRCSSRCRSRSGSRPACRRCGLQSRSRAPRVGSGGSGRPRVPAPTAAPVACRRGRLRSARGERRGRPQRKAHTSCRRGGVRNPTRRATVLAHADAKAVSRAMRCPLRQIGPSPSESRS